MNYLNLELKNNASFDFATVHAAVKPGFSRQLNFDDLFRVLEEQCRPLALQPEYYCGSIRIVPASKKFMNRERRYNQPLSARTKQYLAFCEKEG